MKHIDQITAQLDSDLASMVAHHAKLFQRNGDTVLAQYVIARTFYHAHKAIEFLWLSDKDLDSNENYRKYFDQLSRDMSAYLISRYSDNIIKHFKGVLVDTV